jgi:hypothetical protein
MKSFKGRFSAIDMVLVSINRHHNLLFTHLQPDMSSLEEKEHNVVVESSF